MRAPRPRSPPRARTRAVIHFGRSRWSSGTLGSADTSANDSRDGRVGLESCVRAASGIQNLDHRTRCVIAGEAEEDVLETFLAGGGVRTKLAHGSACAN